jgi:hypothetical protein
MDSVRLYSPLGTAKSSWTLTMVIYLSDGIHLFTSYQLGDYLVRLKVDIEASARGR